MHDTTTTNCSRPHECPRLMRCERFRNRGCWITFGLLLLLILMSVIALYCRGEWLDTRRKLDRQRDLTDAAQISRAHWQGKYEILASRRPLTARQKALLVKYEAAQAAKPLDMLVK